MFLHLGRDIVVPIKNIISIVDVESVKNLKDGKAFLKTAEEEGFVHRISDEKVKSCVITENVEISHGGKEKVVKTIIYYSPISSITLQRRANFIDEIHGIK